jgi:hypothetical protein
MYMYIYIYGAKYFCHLNDTTIMYIIHHLNIVSSNQAIKQSSNQAIKQSSNQAIKQSSNQAIKQSSNQAIINLFPDSRTYLESLWSYLVSHT